MPRRSATPPSSRAHTRAAARALRALVCTLATALALCAGSAIAPQQAHAGQYDVPACDAAPGSVNNSWTYRAGSPAAGTTGSLGDCPSSGAGNGIRCAVNNLQLVAFLTGCVIEFSAPSSTTLAQVTRRDLFARSGLAGCLCAPSNWDAGMFHHTPPNTEFFGCGWGSAGCAVGTGWNGVPVT